MFELIRIELFKIFKKWRTYISFIVIGLLVVIIQVAMSFEGQRSLDFMTRNLQDSFIFVGNLLNGYLISYIILNMLAVHIPFLITLVAGDLLAGEATSGTYRILLTRPVSRMQIVTSKFVAVILPTAKLVVCPRATNSSIAACTSDEANPLAVLSYVTLVAGRLCANVESSSRIFPNNLSNLNAMIIRSLRLLYHSKCCQT